MDYQKNLEAFYRRDDFDACTGAFKRDIQTMQFKPLPYIPRRTSVLPGSMADVVWENELPVKRGRKEACLYLHIPFCNLSCTYCGFFKDQAQESLIEAYSKRLIKELGLWFHKGIFSNRIIKAVFFGGGTPSVLSPQQITKILAEIRKLAVLSDDCEITFESSIFDMDADKFSACLDGGVNRFSFGIQTFNTQVRRSIGRPDSRETLLRKLQAFARSDARIIIDLIYGLPGQTKQDVLDDLQLAMETGVAGLDLYKLQILPESVLGKIIQEGKKEYLFSSSQLADMFISGARYLQNRGCSRLSCCHWGMVSSEESRYNTMVKRGEDIIACGCACGGATGSYKFRKIQGIGSYMKTVEEHAIPVMVFRKRSELYPLLEKLNGQTDRGILDFAELQRLHPMQLEDLLRPVLDKWMADALLEKRNGRYYITLEGSFWYRDIARILLYMTEIAAFGEMTEVEKAEQKQFMMRGMNSLK